MDCHICKKPGANVPDPCCGAFDCDGLADCAHFECLPAWRQAEERRWAEADREVCNR